MRQIQHLVRQIRAEKSKLSQSLETNSELEARKADLDQEMIRIRKLTRHFMKEVIVHLEGEREDIIRELELCSKWEGVLEGVESKRDFLREGLKEIESALQSANFLHENGEE